MAEAQSNDAMGYEQPKAVETAQEPAPTMTAREQLNIAVKEVTVNEDGKLQYPTDMDAMTREAVASEKKFRDTQSGYTKSQMANKELEAENQALQKQLAENHMPLELTKDESERLDDLKFSDPEAWRKELNNLETTKIQEAREKLAESTAEVRQQANHSFEQDRRIGQLEEFNKGREIPLDDNVLANDIPPRISNKLANNEITFSDFLAEVDVYLGKQKVVANPTNPTTPDLHRVTGGATPSNQTGEAEIDYNTVVF